MVYVIIIKHAEFSYSLIESELLLAHQPAAVNFMHLKSIHTPIFTAPFQLEAHLESSQTSVVKFFRGNSQRL